MWYPHTGGSVVTQTVVGTSLGPVSVLVEDGFAVSIKLGGIFEGTPVADLEPFKTQLLEYFERKRKILTFPVILKGTDFQRSVWREVRGIPYGAVRTYGWIARRLKTSPRAVGGALKANPLPLYIPCHRVVSTDGIGGFSSGLDWKRFLLELEGVLL